jgi:hypothetical protein
LSSHYSDDRTLTQAELSIKGLKRRAVFPGHFDNAGERIYRQFTQVFPISAFIRHSSKSLFSLVISALWRYMRSTTRELEWEITSVQYSGLCRIGLVGGDYTEQASRCIAPGGRHLVPGFSGQNVSENDRNSIKACLQTDNHEGLDPCRLNGWLYGPQCNELAPDVDLRGQIRGIELNICRFMVILGV